MSQIFYQVVAGEPLDFCRDLQKRSLSKREEFSNYSEAKGGIGFTERLGFFGGVIFDDDSQRPAGFKIEKRRTSDGHTVCTPEKRTPDGKVLRAEFDALGRLPLSDEFSTHFGIPQSLKYSCEGRGWGGQSLHSGGFSTCQIIWAGDDIWIVLPDIAGTIAGYIADGYTCEPASFTPPAGLRLGTKAQWELALAAHRVAQEQGGAA